MSRNVKRISIIAVYLTLVSLVVFFVWDKLRAAPSCTDGRKNQNETAVDCGGVCGACDPRIDAKLLRVDGVTMVTGGQGRYDVIAKIKNPNLLYGGRTVPYSIILKDAEGLPIERVDNTVFILPSQTRYIAELNIPASTIPARAEVVIYSDQIEWVKFVGFEDPNFLVSGERFGTIENGIGYAQAFGIINNKSAFDFQNVGVIVILKDPQGRPIAANRTTMGDLTAFRQRDFSLSWPYRFPGDIAAMEIEIEANIYDSENFIKKFAPGNGASAR